MFSAWATRPRLRIAVVLLVTALSYGALVHVFQLLTGGLRPYAGPPWLQVYFTSLLVLDPVAAVLLARRHLAGLIVAPVVLITDALANGYANYALDERSGVTTGRVGQVVVSLLALLAVTVAVKAWPPRRRREDHC